MQEEAKCPRGHGLLRRDSEGMLVCWECGYVRPPGELPAEKPDKGKYADKPVKLRRYERARGYHYPEDVKMQAVADVEQGMDRGEVCRRVGCYLMTLDAWMVKYGGKVGKQ